MLLLLTGTFFAILHIHIMHTTSISEFSIEVALIGVRRNRTKHEWVRFLWRNRTLGTHKVTCGFLHMLMSNIFF